MTDNENKTLFYLHELSDYKVADEYPDVRDWEVKDANSRTVGKVEGLLVNKNAERVVYLDVEVDEDVIKAGHETFAAKASEGMHEFKNEDGEDHLIIPIGMVDLDTENKVVLAPEINYDTFAKTSRFRKGNNLSRDYEIIVFNSYIPDSSDKKPFREENDFYNRKEFKDNRDRD